jgi:4-hydroxy-3-methylbut-2-enyl diphosphate reductase
MVESDGWLPTEKKGLKIALTSGASCPDVLVDEVLLKILDYYPESRSVEEVLEPYSELAETH